MNVITSNEGKNILDRLDIDIIKRIDGQYELQELLSKFVNLYFNKMIIDITSIANYKDIETMKKLAEAVDPSRIILLLNDDPAVNNNVFMAKLVELGFYNFTRNYEGIKFLYSTPNTLENVRHLLMSESQMQEQIAELKRVEQERIASEGMVGSFHGRRVIGLANLTIHAGATSLTNMMVRQLNAKGYSAIGLEMFRQDLIFYHDPTHLHSCMNKSDLESKLKLYADVNVIIIDLNEFGEAEKYCDIILYLLEPSYVRMTRLIKKNRNAFEDNRDHKIVLNMSFVNDQEVPDFEYETKLKVFDNLPPVNDRNQNLLEVNQLLMKLGFDMTRDGYNSQLN